MKNFLPLFFLSFVTLSFSQIKNNTTGFIENKGQIVNQKNKPNPSVKYLLNTNGLNVQLREKGFSYDVYETEKIPLTKKDKDFHLFNPNFDNKKEIPDYSLKYNFHRIDFTFLNSNTNAKIIPEEKSKDYDNYYNVVHAPDGITNVHKYQKVTYQNIYNQIDVVFFIPNDSTKVVEYNFIVKPGGKISDIQLKIEGGKTELVENKIRMHLRFGQMEETIPMSWTEQENNKSEIKINYKKIKKNVYGFEGDLNSSDKTIVIDPVPIRLWGTYYGGDYSDHISEATTDNLGYLIITGNTLSRNNLTTTGAFISNHYSTNPAIFSPDGYVSKLDFNGYKIWATYLKAQANDIDVDSNNNIISTGYALQFDIIGTTGTHKPTKLSNDFDGYILKLNPDGQRIWGTFYGGDSYGEDIISSASVDIFNNIFITGYAYSDTNIATTGTHKEIKNSGYKDGFIAKMSPNGQRIWGTYYGGSNDDEGISITIDVNNNTYIVGITQSSNGIAYGNSHQSNFINNYRTGFISGFNNNGNIIFGTYIGGNFNDEFNKIDYYNQKILISGKTLSSNISTTTNAPYPNPTSNISSISNGYFAEFSTNGSIIMGSYFQNQITDSGYDNEGNIFINGISNTPGIGTPNSYQPNLYNWSPDAYIVKFNENYIKEWGTYYGGESQEMESILHLDKMTNFIYIGGRTTSSTNLTSSNSYQPIKDTNRDDIFLIKFYDCQSSSLASSNSPICIGSNLALTASGGTNYSWTGPNGFTSTDQNPIIPNANTTHSGQYSCAISGTGGCDDTITLNVVVGDSEAPVPTVLNLPTISGDCNTLISTIPTASDNCAGLINATTTNPLSYSLPGSYTVNWNYTDGNGNSSSQTQNIIISSVVLPTLTSPQIFCIQQNATINNIAITGQNIKWYDASNGGNLLPNTTSLQNAITYYASQTISGCESTRVPVLVTIQNTLAPTGNPNQSFCSTENATLNSIAITGNNVIWYTSSTGTTALPNSTLLQNGVTYYASQTINGCESISRLAVSIQLINTLNANNYSETICDDLNNGFETVNLSNYNSFLISATGNSFKYFNSLNGAENQIPADEVQNSTNYNLSIGNNLFYVRIESPNTCFQIVTLNLIVVEKPFVTISDIMPICEGSSITINAGFGYDDYLWSTNEIGTSITVTQPGNYSVTVSENHGALVCSTTKNFTVVNSNIGTISEIITSDWTQNENTISVLLTSNSVGNYEYSLNGIDFQDSNSFYGLENGEYTVFIRDKNGCGISSEDVYLLMYPKYFTPNGDGYNDYWRIKFSENEPNLMVTIFDRFGKLIKQFDTNSIGWDGTYNGEQQFSTDYWFVVKRENGKEYKGHFTLKR